MHPRTAGVFFCADQLWNSVSTAPVLEMPYRMSCSDVWFGESFQEIGCMSVVGILLWALVIYTLIGVVVAVRFLWIVAPKVDQVFADAPVRVRVLFFPGAVGVWPIVLRRSSTLMSSSRESDQ